MRPPQFLSYVPKTYQTALDVSEIAVCQTIHIAFISYRDVMSCDMRASLFAVMFLLVTVCRLSILFIIWILLAPR
jgi:hypothetical protein